MGALAATLTATPSADSNSGSSNFNAGSSSFVPRKKAGATTISATTSAEVKTDFPTLGDTASAGDKKKKATKEPVKKEPEDPTFGKSKEFFIYEFDQARNACICNMDQLAFISIHYPEHYFSPIDILMWLYDMAEFKEQTEYDNIYNQGPSKSSAKITTTTGSKATKKKQVIEEYDENEDTTFSIKSYKDLNKKKPVLPPKPLGGAGGKVLTEAQKEEQRQTKLKQM
jgi:hypothetical protein